SNDRAGVNANIAAELGAGIESDIRKNAAIFSDVAVAADMVQRLQHGARTDPDALAHHAVRPDMRAGCDARGRMDDRSRVDARGEMLFGEEHRHGPREADAGVGYFYERFVPGLGFGIDEHCGSRAFLGAREVKIVFSDGEIARLRGN